MVTASVQLPLFGNGLPDPRDYISSPVIAVHVGKSKKLHNVHQIMLTAHSNYFEGCLKPGFKEYDTRTVTIEDVDENLFGQMILWLYSRKFVVPIDKNFITTPMIRLYALADRLIMPRFKNEIVDHMREYLEAAKIQPGNGDLKTMHKKGLLDRPLGNYFITHMARRLVKEPGIWSGDLEDAAAKARHKSIQEVYKVPEIAVEILKCIAERGKTDWIDPTWSGGCVFHEHEAGELCYKTKDTRTPPKDNASLKWN